MGTALRTVALRLTNTKGKLEELDEDSEGAAESITKLQTQLLNLTGGKVNIMLDENTFKSTYQIMVEMSEVWDSMTQKDQMEALELMAGKRQSNIVGSIISNMAEGQKAVETSLNSAGSAMKENDKWLDSIEGKSSRVSASFEQISTSVIDSTVVKFLMDVGYFLLEILNLADGLPAKILTIVTAFTVLKATFITLKGLTFFQNLGTSITALTGRVKKTTLFEYARYIVVVTLNELTTNMVLLTKRYIANNLNGMHKKHISFIN